MVPYYSFSNLFFYSISIISLCFLIPALIYIKEFQGSKVMVLFLGFFASLFVFWPLSGTCPYPAVKTALFFLNIICIWGTIFFGILLIINKLKGRPLIFFTKREAHRWIMKTMGGHYLITNPSGQILSCGQTVLSPMVPYHAETLNSFLKRAAALLNDTSNNWEALESLYNDILENKDSSGNIEISDRHYHWIYRRLGKHELQGYLLYLTDLTEEQSLINQREETGRLLHLRNGWLRKQGQLAISLKRSRLTEELSQKTTKIITSHLIILTKDLRHLAETDTPDQEDINKALIKSKEVMSQIRKAVHTLPYTEGKEIS
jgi:hypothetical protein